MESGDRMEHLRMRAQYKRYLPGQPLPWERNGMLTRRVLSSLLEEHPIETLALFPFERLREAVRTAWDPFDEDTLLTQIDLDHPEWIVPPATGEDGSDRMQPFWRAYEERLSAIEAFEESAIDSATSRLQSVIAKRAKTRNLGGKRNRDMFGAPERWVDTYRRRDDLGVI